jgi:transposase
MSTPMAETTRSRRARRQFTDEFKASVVRLVLDEGKTVGAAARDLDLTETAVREWVKRARADRTKGRTGLTTAEREELARLRKENRILQEERDILKNQSRAMAPDVWTRNSSGSTLVRPGPWPSAFWCRSEPVKKHGPGVACAHVSGDAFG